MIGKDRMKILQIIPFYYPERRYGGAPLSVFLMNKALCQKGISVDVFTMRGGLDGNFIPEDRWVDLDGVRAKYFKYYGDVAYSFSPRFSFNALTQAGGYDLIHISGVWNLHALAGSIAGLLHKKPFIISPRGTIYEEIFNLRAKEIKKFYYRAVVKQYLKRASALHFTTGDEREKVLGYLKLDCESFVVPNGLDLSSFRNMPPAGSFSKRYPELENKKFILSLGRMTHKKGFDILAEAFKKIYRSHPDVFLVIAGPDNDGYGQTVKGFFHKNGTIDRVIFAGMLAGKDVLEAYNDAEVFVLPSYSENFGMVVIEAMACGTPVILSDKVGIYKEVEKNEAGIVINTDAESFYSALKMVLGSQALRKKLSANGRELVEQYYDINRAADKMAEAYERILEKS